MGDWDHAIAVITFAMKLKDRLHTLGKLGKKVRVLCPNEAHKGATPPVYVWAMLAKSSRDKRGHIHLACEDETCCYRMME